MTIDEAISHALEVAESCEWQALQCDVTDAYENHVKGENEQCAANHRQLVEWLAELKEAKRLLKAAVEDIHDILTSQRRITNNSLCFRCSYYLNCTCKEICETRCDLKQWRYTDEALKLIGGSENGTCV